MSYYRDLTLYEYSLHGNSKPVDHVINVGWLDKTHEFETGPIDEKVLAILKGMQPTHLMRGSHECQWCPRPEPNRLAPYGNGEYRIGYNGITYVAPKLITHYIEVHNYQPPTLFNEAVLSNRGSIL